MVISVRSEYRGRKIRFIDRIREILRLKTHAASWLVRSTALARFLGDTIAGIKLHTRQCCVGFQLSAALGVLYLRDLPECAIRMVNHKIVVITERQFRCQSGRSVCTGCSRQC